MSANGGELTRLQKDRNDLQQDVLAAFFKGPERFDELPRRRTGSAKRPIALGELVEGPLIDFPAEQKADGVCFQEVEKDGMYSCPFHLSLSNQVLWNMLVGGR